LSNILSPDPEICCSSYSYHPDLKKPPLPPLLGIVDVVVVVAEAVQQKKVVVGLKVTVERGVVEEKLDRLVLVVILVLFVPKRPYAHRRTFGMSKADRNNQRRIRSSCTDNHKPDI
jgi:hypothetical protein